MNGNSDVSHENLDERDGPGKQRRRKASHEPPDGSTQHPLEGALDGALEGDRVATLLTRIVDLAFIGIIFIAPYCMGGRHPLGRFLFIVLAVGLATAWLLRQCRFAGVGWRRSGAEWLILGGILLLLVQLTPLPATVLSAIAPHGSDVLPLWSSTSDVSRLGTWSQLSLHPHATVSALVTFLSYSIIFLVAVQRIEDVRDVQTMLRWIALSAILMAGFGIVQYVGSNGKFLWIYEHPYRDTSGTVKGSFINRNHFAHMLALGLGPLSLWLLRALRDRQKSAERNGFRIQHGLPRADVTVAALAIAMGVVLFAGLMSFSRGGAIAMAVALVVPGALFFRARLLTRNWFVGVVGIALLVLASLSIHGYDRLAGRLDDFTAGSLDELDQGQVRRRLWGANLSAARDHFLFGTGLGSHREVYPMYLEETVPVEHTHAESGYLQVASEGGVVGVVLLAVGIGLCVFWCVAGIAHSKSKRVTACLAAVSGGLAASIVHSLVDFVWFIPACMALTVVLAACALRLFQMANGRSVKTVPVTSPPRVVWAAGFGGLAILGVWMIHAALGPAIASIHWDRYLRASVVAFDLQKERLEEIEASLDLTPTDEQAEVVSTMADHLTAVLNWDPGHARAHLRMAGICLKQFAHFQSESQNRMDLSQIRDAAIASQFASRAALDEWLDRAVGNHRQLLDTALMHARHGLTLCPLQGVGYLFLSELCFLEGGRDAEKAALLDQALKVRPWDAEVLFQAGKESLLLGNDEQAIDYWRRYFHKGGFHQAKLIHLWARRVPIEFFLEHFEPDLRACRLLRERYRQQANSDAYRDFLQHYAEHATEKAETLRGEPAAMRWLEGLRLYRELTADDLADHCASKALDCAPNNFLVRYSLGRFMLKQEKYDEAKKHLRWCSYRKPDDVNVKTLLKAVNAGRLAAPRTAERDEDGRL